jgi:hypothetical protein
LSITQLFGWSPDSRIVLVLAEGDHLFAVSAKPPGPAVIEKCVREGRGEESARPTARACLLFSVFGPPIFDPRVSPTWSVGAQYLAFLLPDREIAKRRYPRWPDSDAPEGRLLIQETRRTYVRLPDELQARRARALTNIKSVALAVQMYLADNDDRFPLVTDTEGLVPILVGKGYVGRSAFADPDGEDQEIVLSYVGPPGISLVNVDDPMAAPLVIGDYDPDFIVIGYCDGHAGLLPRTPEYEERFKEWQEEFKRLRAEDPQAIPPPFPS